MVLISLPPHICSHPTCSRWWHEIEKYEFGVFSIELTFIPKFRETRPFYSRKESGTKYGGHIIELMKAANKVEELKYDFFVDQTFVPGIQETPV
jgi:hypothetical protein